MLKEKNVIARFTWFITEKLMLFSNFGSIGLKLTHRVKSNIYNILHISNSVDLWF